MTKTSSFLQKFLVQYWKSVLFVCVIVYLSFAQPSTFKNAPKFFSIDKVVHILIYFAFEIVLIKDFLKTKIENRSQKSKFILLLVIPIIFGGAIEIMQETFFKPRSAEWIDWLCDIIGITLGYIYMKRFFKK